MKFTEDITHRNVYTILLAIGVFRTAAEDYNLTYSPILIIYLYLIYGLSYLYWRDNWVFPISGIAVGLTHFIPMTIAIFHNSINYRAIIIDGCISLFLFIFCGSILLKRIKNQHNQIDTK